MIRLRSWIDRHYAAVRGVNAGIDPPLGTGALSRCWPASGAAALRPVPAEDDQCSLTTG